MADVFANSGCSLPFTEAIDDFNFISSCTLPDPPAPIYDCPDVDIQIPLIGFTGPTGPQGITGPCPALSIVTTTTVTSGYKALVEATVQNTDGDCIPSIQFDFQVPCPQMSVQVGAVSTTQSGTQASVVVTDVGSQSCNPIFNFDFSIPLGPQGPCPQMVVQVGSVTPAQSG